MVPSSTASTSMVALSVSISAMMSPDLTLSPSRLSHLARLPFSIVGDSAGMRMLIGMASRPSAFLASGRGPCGLLCGFFGFRRGPLCFHCACARLGTHRLGAHDGCEGLHNRDRPVLFFEPCLRRRVDRPEPLRTLRQPLAPLCRRFECRQRGDVNLVINDAETKNFQPAVLKRLLR